LAPNKTVNQYSSSNGGHCLCLILLILQSLSWCWCFCHCHKRCQSTWATR